MAYLELIDIEKKYGDFSLSLSLSADEGEFVGVVWVDVDDAVEAIRQGLIQDAKTVEGILAAKAYGML